MRIIFALIAFVGLLLSGGCSYHYHLYVSISPAAAGETDQSRSTKESSPIEPGIGTNPMSIEPGQFTASQTKGGNMINVILNVNSSKPTEVSTDATLSGVPGL